MNSADSAVRISHPILKGILVSFIASLLYSYAFTLAIAGVRSPTQAAYAFFPALMALPLMSWFIVAVGVLLGAMLPRIAAWFAKRQAALCGAGCGFVLGAAGGSLLVFLFTTGERRFYGYLGLTMAAYMAIWVGAFAYYYSPKER